MSQTGMAQSGRGRAEGDLDREAAGQQLWKGDPRDKQVRRRQREQVEEVPCAGGYLGIFSFFHIFDRGGEMSNATPTFQEPTAFFF